jgi:nucleoside-diphosphate-sugar epimerase
MKILVTGATGFLGNYVIEELLKNDSFSIVATSRSENSAKGKSWYSKVSFIPFDINSVKDFEGNLVSYFQNPDCIIHLAWENLPNYNETFHFEVNLYSHYFFLKKLIEDGLKSITITGTCLEYGMQSGSLNESMPTLPSNPYAIAKDTLRKMIEVLQAKNNFNLNWLRLFYMYGEGQAPSSLYTQLSTAIKNNDSSFNMSGGEQLRDFLSVTEVAAIICGLSMRNKNIGVVNCCSGKPQKVKDFAQSIIDENTSNIKLNLGFYPYTDYEPMEFWGERSKLDKILNSKVF